MVSCLGTRTFPMPAVTRSPSGHPGDCSWAFSPHLFRMSLLLPDPISSCVSSNKVCCVTVYSLFSGEVPGGGEEPEAQFQKLPEEGTGAVGAQGGSGRQRKSGGSRGSGHGEGKHREGKEAESQRLLSSETHKGRGRVGRNYSAASRRGRLNARPPFLLSIRPSFCPSMHPSIHRPSVCHLLGIPPSCSPSHLRVPHRSGQSHTEVSAGWVGAGVVTEDWSWWGQ